MQCEDAIDLLNEHIDNELSANQKTMLNLHLATCKACRDALFQREMLVQRLSEMVVPRAPGHLRERIKRQRNQASKQRRQNLHWFVAGIGFAATLAIMVIMLKTSIRSPDIQAPDYTIKLSGTKNITLDKKVHLLLHSNRGLDDVKFSVLMPDSVELKGYSGRHKIAWIGKLEKGENVLSLPLMVAVKMAQTKKAEVVVRIEHENARREYHIQLAAKG